LTRKSFNHAYTGDPRSGAAAFIKTFVSFEQILDITVVAEGVETQSQLTLLQSYDCHVFQGYYLSPPLPTDEFQHRFIGR